VTDQLLSQHLSGIHTISLFRQHGAHTSSKQRLRDRNPADRTGQHHTARKVGDGIDTVGLYEPATGNWILHSTNAAAGTNTTFQFGGSQYRPVVGDWNNDGTDTVGQVRW
jgi:hypothetical protein